MIKSEYKILTKWINYKWVCINVFEDIIYILQFWFSINLILGMHGGPRSFSQKLLPQDEEIHVRLLECGGFAVIRLTYRGSMRAPFSSFSKVYCCKTHVFSLFAGDVSEVLGSFPYPQKIGSHSYHDKRNGKCLIFDIFGCDQRYS